MRAGNGGVIGIKNIEQSGVWTLEDHFLDRNFIRTGISRIVSFGYKHPNLTQSGLQLYGTAAPVGGYTLTMGRLDCEFVGKQYIEILFTNVSVNLTGLSNANGGVNKTYYKDGQLYINYGGTGGSNANYGAYFGNGDRIGISYNPEIGKMRFWKNGTAQPEIDILAEGSRYPTLKAGTNSTIAYNFTFCVSEATMNYLPSGYFPFDKVK